MLMQGLQVRVNACASQPGFMVMVNQLVSSIVTANDGVRRGRLPCHTLAGHGRDIKTMGLRPAQMTVRPVIIVDYTI